MRKKEPGLRLTISISVVQQHKVCVELFSKKNR